MVRLAPARNTDFLRNPLGVAIIHNLYGIEGNENRLTRRDKMKIRLNIISIFAATFMLVVLSLPAWAWPSQPPQNRETSQTQSMEKDEAQKPGSSTGKEIGKG